MSSYLYLSFVAIFYFGIFCTYFYVALKILSLDEPDNGHSTSRSDNRHTPLLFDQIRTRDMRLNQRLLQTKASHTLHVLH